MDFHATSLCSWVGSVSNSENFNLNRSYGEEDVFISTSFATNASNSSGLSIKSSQRSENAPIVDVHGEAVSDNHHLWNQVLLSVGTTGELQNISTDMFEPACDYLKKIDCVWEFSSPTNLNNLDKNFDGYKDSVNQRKNTDFFNNWSSTPPEVDINQQYSDQYDSKITQIKNENGYQINTIDTSVVNGTSFGDVITFGSFLNKPILDVNVSNKPVLKTMTLSDRRKEKSFYQPINSKCNTLNKSNVISNERKRKKSEDNSAVKKPKHETSALSSSKVQVPKVKLGEKITALQQIVSPFGKTDTASVLWEAIGYITCLQEQVKLLSNPYMKITNVIKDPWGRLNNKDKGDLKVDLKSKGLCLVPTSCTPQVCHDNNGSDYWTPTYRGCFYG